MNRRRFLGAIAGAIAGRWLPAPRPARMGFFVHGGGYWAPRVPPVTVSREESLAAFKALNTMLDRWHTEQIESLIMAPRPPWVGEKIGDTIAIKRPACV